MLQTAAEGEAALDALGLPAFLEADDRPTLVTDVAAPQDPSQILYSNPAFARFRQSISRDDVDQSDAYVRSLLHSASITTSSEVIHHDRTWTTFTLHKRWRVIASPNGYGQARGRDVVKKRPLDLDRPEAKRARVSTRSQAGDSVSPNANVPERSSVIHRGNVSYIDWTERDIPGLPPYVQSFRDRDWSSTPLGPMASWPFELRLMVLNIMSSPDPRIVLWGPEGTLLYNEPSVPILGAKHPLALGSSVRDVFIEMWDHLKPLVEAAMRDGKTSQLLQMPLPLLRSPGFMEETYFTFTMQPILGQNGTPAGVLDLFTEVTGIVLAERRMRTVLSVGENAAGAETLEGVWKGALAALESNTEDVPFAFVYSMNRDDVSDSPSAEHGSGSIDPDTPGARSCTMQGVVGFEESPQSLPEILYLDDDDRPFVREFRKVWKEGRRLHLDVKDGTLPTEFAQAMPGRVAGVPSSRAIVLPISSGSASNFLGFLVLGLSERRPYDEDYELFVRLLNDRLNHSTAIVSLPKEQRLIQAAAEEAALRHAALSRQLLLRTEEAEQREAKFARMASAAPLGCYMLRVDGTPIYLNDAYYDITGVEKPEDLSFAADSTWRAQVLPEDIPKVEKSWFEVVNDKKPTMVEYRLLREWRSFDDATGVDMHGPTWLLVTAFPELDDDGNVKTVIGWVSDISLQKWTEDLKAKRLIEALESKVQSERFIDLVSHEMRNPLSAILQSADGILASLKDVDFTNVPSSGRSSPSENLGDALIDGAKTIILCAQHQKRIVDDILTLSKLDSDLLELSPEVARPTELTEKVLKMYEAELQASDIAANIKIDESFQKLTIDQVFLDSSRLLQVLINLVTNAIRFTRTKAHRQITITLRASSAQPQPGTSISYMPRRISRPELSLSSEWGDGEDVYLLFAIEDSGTGLTQDEMRLLFVRFSQANHRTHAQYGGSGLGLFISKELTELQGGQIGASSTYGEGSTFAFYIKVRRYVSTAERTAKDAQTLNKNNKAHTRIPAALESKGDRQASELPQQPVIAPRNPFPTPDSLSPPPTTPAKVRARKAEDLHVLIVEDNIINQKVMSAGLKRLGCTVHVANHGLEALNFLEKSCFKTRVNLSPDLAQFDADLVSQAVPIPLSLILLDLEMPVMDGITCIQRIREMERNGELSGRIPVAAVTANARTEQLNNALKNGMDAVVTKPFRIPELVPKMLSLVEGTNIGSRISYSFNVG